VNGKGMIGLDDTKAKASSGPEKVKRTQLVEPSENGMKVISRSKGFRSAYERRSHGKMVSMLLVCAATIIIVSAVAVASFGKEAQPTVPGRVSVPGFPFYVIGYTTDAGLVVIPNVVVTIRDVTTGSVNKTVSDTAGFYSFDIQLGNPAINAGDIIRVNASTTTLSGTNQTTATVAPYVEVWVAMSITIPEFTTIAIPIAGMVSILAVARVASSRREEE